MRERVASFGARGALRGVIAGPPPGAGTGWGVVLLNAGLVHRVGPNRVYVRLGRSLAALGFTALRFDFSGVGDSPAREDGEPFARAAVEETRAALDWLSRQHGCERFVLAGICSGAEIAFKTACRDSRVAGAVLLNASRYEDEPSPQVLARVERQGASHYHRRVAVYNPESWLRLISGRANYRSILRGLGESAGSLVRWRRGASELRNGDVEAFETLVGRGVRLLLIFSEGDWGFNYLRTVLGRRLDEWRASSNPRVEVIQGSDHILTPLPSREQGMRAILDWARTLASADAS